jgi:uncharacterized SAM-binding protein YcdF (DUF218 family)
VTSRRFPRARTIAVAGLAGALVLAVIALRFGGDTLVVSRDVPRPQAIVVLASHEWERLPVAAQLGRRYPQAQVLLTQPVHVTEHNCYECAERVSRLSQLGIDRRRVILLPRLVTNTYDEARAAAAFAERSGLQRMTIVTSPYHGRRALATFRHLFRDAGLPTELGLATTVAGIDPDWWWLRRYDRDYVAYEWTGIVYYAIRFGVPPVV